MSINKKIIITAVLGLALGMSSCRKFFDINKQPNRSSDATVETLLPAAQLLVASVQGVEFQVNGSLWGQYWTQSPNASQYKSFEQYTPSQDGYSTPWINLYAAAENFYQMGVLADTLKKKQYKAIALVMRAYTFQLITDAWGDVPYTEALKGLIVDSNITNPKYDSQRVVYNGILRDIDSALVLINPSDIVLPGKDDLIFGGDMLMWRKFAYTLKLKIYMRMSEKDPVAAQAGVAALYADVNHTFLVRGEDAKIAFGYSASSKSPLYAEATSTTQAGTQNLAASATTVDSMIVNNDYRLYAFYSPTPSGAFVGLKQGNYNIPVVAGTYSLPSPYVAGDANNDKSANAPVMLLTSYESLFLQAEAVARGWAPGDDVALFNEAIHASFNAYAFAYDDLKIVWQDTAGGYTLPGGTQLSAPVMLTSDFAYYSYVHGDTTYLTPAGIDVPAYWAIYNAGMPLPTKLKKIITQKWFSMCGNQGFEAWTEQRRTGYPDFFVISANSLSGSSFPKRFLYPTAESTRNSSFPGLISLFTKVWWDVL